jgi:hypothetical protein
MKTIPTKAEVESWLKNSWSRILVFLQKLRANKKVNDAVCQVQQRLGPELQKIRDDKRVQEAASKLKPYRRKIMAGGIGLFLIWAVFPSGSDAKRATIEYWASLNTIFKDKHLSEEAIKSQEAKSRQELIAKLNQEQAVLEKAQSRIQELPVQDVDADLIKFIHETSEALQKENMAYMKASVFLSDLETEDKNMGGLDTVAKHVLRIFSGDYASPFNEMDNLKGERKSRWHAIWGEMNVAMEGLIKIRSDQIPLRSLLTKRYGVEFR